MYFTVCIPAYNRAHTIGRTLESLTNQIFKDFEVLVIDDGSKDNTQEVVKKYKDKLNLNYYFKENGGKHTALNKGIELAKGLFFVILDSDDYFLEDTLQNFYKACEKIKDDDSYCGVIASSLDSATGKRIGDELPQDSMSYIDMHYYFPQKHINIYDCCECNKTKLLKQYRFPEQSGMRFVPEAYLFDQIGIKHKLYCLNKIVKICEYQLDGITLNNKFKINNNIGYLFHYVSRIENIIPNIKSNLIIKVVAWWRYWSSVSLDNDKNGPRVKKINILGFFVKNCVPILNKIYKLHYTKP